MFNTPRPDAPLRDSPLPPPLPLVAGNVIIRPNATLSGIDVSKAFPKHSPVTRRTRQWRRISARAPGEFFVFGGILGNVA